MKQLAQLLFSAVLCAVCAVVLAACGGGDGSKAGGPEGGKGANANVTNGKKLFQGKCGSCHTLADAGTAGTVGPDLDQLQSTAERVRGQIESGGGGMPANLVEGSDATDVAAYVERVAGK